MVTFHPTTVSYFHRNGQLYAVVPPTLVQTLNWSLIYHLPCIKCYQIQISEESRAPATASNTVSPSMRPTEICSLILLPSQSKFIAGNVPATLTQRSNSWKLSLPPTYYIRPWLHPGHITAGLCEQWFFVILFQQTKWKQHYPKLLYEYATHSSPL